MGEYGRMNKVFGLNFVSCFMHLHALSYSTFSWAQQILKELHKSCRREDGTDDHKKGTQLLEVYAIEIQMYTETKNNKKLKVVWLFVTSN